MAIFTVTNSSPGVLILNDDFQSETLPDVSMDDERHTYIRWFLVPSSLVPQSVINNLTKVTSGIYFTNTRSKGSITIAPNICSGSPASYEEVYDNLYVTSTNHTNTRVNALTPTTTEDNFIPNYKSGAILFNYNGIQYYALKVESGVGGILAKYTGTFKINSFEMSFEYDDTSKLFVGSKQVTSAYLGNTPLTGIYLGNTKLL